MHAWRLIQQTYVAQAFSGEGARLYGGRWNSPGRACVYMTSAVSLGLLEILAGMKKSDLPDDYVVMTLTLNDSDVITLEDTTPLPKDWQGLPPPPSTTAIGNAWLASGDSLVLSVPSTISPKERNYLLNPAHPNFADTVATARQIPFHFDPRLGLH